MRARRRPACGRQPASGSPGRPGRTGPAVGQSSGPLRSPVPPAVVSPAVRRRTAVRLESPMRPRALRRNLRAVPRRPQTGTRHTEWRRATVCSRGWVLLLSGISGWCSLCHFPRRRSLQDSKSARPTQYYSIHGSPTKWLRRDGWRGAHDHCGWVFGSCYGAGGWRGVRPPSRGRLARTAVRQNDEVNQGAGHLPGTGGAKMIFAPIFPGPLGPGNGCYTVSAGTFRRRG